MRNVITPRFFGQQLRSGHWSTDGLAFYFRGIPAGNVVDESMYGNHGTITGADWVGDGLSFNGTTDFVSVGDKPQFEGMAQLTVVAIGTMDTAAAAFRAYCGKRFTGAESFSLGSDSSGRLEFAVENDSGVMKISHSGSDGITINDGERRMVVGRYDGAFLNIFIDGVQLLKSSAITTQTGAVNDSEEEFAIGAIQNGGSTSRHFDGTIEYIAIYNRALSASEIFELTISPDLPIRQDNISLWTPVGVNIPVMIHHYKQAGGL